MTTAEPPCSIKPRRRTFRHRLALEPHGRLPRHKAKSRTGVTPYGLLETIAAAQPAIPIQSANAQIVAQEAGKFQMAHAPLCAKGWPRRNAIANIVSAVERLRPMHGRKRPSPVRTNQWENQAMPIVTWDHVHLRSPD